jgi:hypothetical protein
MKLHLALRSTHDLKKASYSMLKKFHKIEYRGSLRECAKLGNEPYLVLCLEHMSSVIKNCYTDTFTGYSGLSQLDTLIQSLKSTALTRMRIDRRILVSCLVAHTEFFNFLEMNRHRIATNKDIVDEWNIKCVMAFLAQFGNKL